jgi:branched-chain amino acid aminotransferase
VHVLTHTLHYGLGVFEGIRCYASEGRPSAVFRLEEHVDRLFGSAHILDLPIPYTRAQIAEACLETIRANRLAECYIRPIAFMGDGEMGLASRPATRVAIAVWQWGAYLGEDGIKRGVRLKTSSFQRFHPNTLLTKAKAVGHYVNSILAAREARDAGYDEALLLDVDGYVSEASGENIFIVSKGVVKTTPLPTVLAGITRDAVLELLHEFGLPVREERFTRDEAYLADEAFFTGTAAEVTPVREVDDRQVGDGTPGPVTRKLQDLFFRIVHGREDRYRKWLAEV